MPIANFCYEMSDEDIYTSLKLYKGFLFNKSNNRAIPELYLNIRKTMKTHFRTLNVKSSKSISSQLNDISKEIIDPIIKCSTLDNIKKYIGNLAGNGCSKLLENAIKEIGIQASLLSSHITIGFVSGSFIPGLGNLTGALVGFTTGLVHSLSTSIDYAHKAYQLIQSAMALRFIKDITILSILLELYHVAFEKNPQLLKYNSKKYYHSNKILIGIKKPLLAESITIIFNEYVENVSKEPMLAFSLVEHALVYKLSSKYPLLIPYYYLMRFEENSKKNNICKIKKDIINLHNRGELNNPHNIPYATLANLWLPTANVNQFLENVEKLPISLNSPDLITSLVIILSKENYHPFDPNLFISEQIKKLKIDNYLFDLPFFKIMNPINDIKDFMHPSKIKLQNHLNLVHAKRDARNKIESTFNWRDKDNSLNRFTQFFCYSSYYKSIESISALEGLSDYIS